ncbi:MAG: glycosyltransferase family 4 protein [Firmicutes bacterium]|nr:glycosyltransferase family 4 protein [Bacillota bacterium]
MNIIIDTRMIYDRLHGIARYLYEILKVFNDRYIPHNVSLITNNPGTLKKLGLAGRFDFIEAKSRPFHPMEFLEIPSILKKSKADLFHAPSISVPPFKTVPTVITVHDLIPYHEGSMFHRMYCNYVLRNAIGYSQAVITDAEYTKEDVVKYMGCPEDKIRVIHASTSISQSDEITWKEVSRKFRLKKPYVFCLANPRPHKNLTGLISMFEMARAGSPKEFSLVIGSKTSEELEAKISASPYKNDIIRINYLEDDELGIIYENARVFAFPSFFEGFGLPPLEAMSFGCPVVCSNRTSLPEVVGEGGILEDPSDKKAFAAHILRLMTDDELYSEYSARAKERSRFFSWEKCAMETLEVYENAVKKN